MACPEVAANVDFETFSEISILDVGTCRAAEHPSTEILCAGWAIGDEEPSVWVPSAALFDIREAQLPPSPFRARLHSKPPFRLFDHVKAGGLVYAWNVEMEIPHWEEICVKRMGWEPIPRDQWRDTQALALTLALPAALGNAGAALGLDILKDHRGEHLLNKLAKPRRPSKHNARTRWEVSQVPVDYADLYDYCAQDVRAERAIHRALPIDDLDPAELELFRMTTEQNLRGWTVDIESARRMLAVLDEHKKREVGRLMELTEGEITTGGQLARMLSWLADRGVFLDNMQADTIEIALMNSHLPPECRRLLEIRQALGKASTGKFNAMEDRVCDDGTVKNNTLHHGCSTGRDAHKGMQIGNFVRAAISKTEWGVEVAFRALRTNRPLETIELLYGSPTNYASLMTRSHLIAAPGHEMFCADFSQIENRIAALHSGCKYALDIFEKALDEYIQFASVFYDIPYEEVTDAQRQHSKHAVLLFIFGGGELALCNQAVRFGTFIEMDDAKELKRTYRKDLYPEVVAMWYGMDKAAKRCVHFGETTSYNEIGFRFEDNFLMMDLPSGRSLAYYDPMIEMKMAPWGKKKLTITHMGVDSKSYKWVRMKLIPGRIFQNSVQASARDAMMAGARRTTRALYALVGRVHDELASQRPIGEGNLQEYCKLMSTPDPWLDGVPIIASGWSGQRFRK